MQAHSDCHIYYTLVMKFLIFYTSIINKKGHLMLERKDIVRRIHTALIVSCIRCVDSTKCSFLLKIEDVGMDAPPRTETQHARDQFFLLFFFFLKKKSKCSNLA